MIPGSAVTSTGNPTRCRLFGRHMTNVTAAHVPTINHHGKRIDGPRPPHIHLGHAKYSHSRFGRILPAGVLTRSKPTCH